MEESGGQRKRGNLKIKESPGKAAGAAWVVMRRRENYAGRRAMGMEVKEGHRRRRVKMKRRWMNSVTNDIRENGLS